MKRAATALLLAGMLAASAGAAAPRLNVTLSPRPDALESHAPWTATITVRRGQKPYRGKAPRLEVRSGSARAAFPSRRLRAGSFRARVVFPSAGRWRLAVRVAGKRVPAGAVLVTPGLTNVLDVAVLPDGNLLASDMSNYVFRAPAGGPLTVVAGNGRSGTSGDGGPAVDAAVGFPVEVAPDPRGGFSIVSEERFLRRVGPDGTITTLAELDAPTAHAYDAAGNVYVSELGGRIKRIDAATGVMTTLAEGLNRPHGLVVDRDGGLIVCETFANRLARIDLTTRAVTTFAAGLDQPNDVALAEDGTLYVSEYGRDRIARVSRNGAVTTLAAALGPNSVAVDEAGFVYHTERERPRVRRIDPATGSSTIVLGR